MTNQAQRFIELHSRAFPGVPIPPLPRHPEELGLSVQLALRDADAGWWQNQFGGRDDRGEQARLPADVEQRMLAGTPHPEDEAALRKANMDFYANAAAAQREQVIERAREATRAREKAIFQQQAQKSAELRSMGILGRMAASPLRPTRSLKPVPNGASQANDGVGSSYGQTHSGGIR